MAEYSVHAIVTKPPYKENYQEWCEQWGKGALDSLKPGGHMLAIAPKEYYRLFTGVEESGFEIRDSIMWFRRGNIIPITLARKPLEKDTIADQVLETGTGALNIDECRIGTKSEVRKPGSNGNQGFDGDERVYGDGDEMRGSDWGPNDGRHPANIVLDDVSAKMLDEQSGDLESGEFRPAGTSERDSEMFDPDSGWNQHSMDPNDQKAPENYGDSGGASRFFYNSYNYENLVEWLVTLSSAKGQTVLDPFAEEDTIPEVARSIERNAIGMNWNE